MGIQDRSYYGDDERVSQLGGRSMVVNLIILNAAIYVADWVSEGQLRKWMMLQGDLFQKPWQCWQLVTYGFVHDTDIMHILFNMIGLWLFGTDVEQIYGKAEFLRIYLTAIVVSGLVYVTAGALAGHESSLIGASGGVAGLMIIYVLHFPQRTIYIWGVVPVRAWALGAFWVLLDIMGAASNNENGNVAHVAHLSGAAFGFVYYKSGWNLGRLVPSRLSGAMFRMRPRLRIHDPEADSRTLTQQVDAILEKISRQGESSLTKKERRTLEEASRRYQRRRD